MAQSEESGCGFLVFGVILLYFLAPTDWTNSIWYGIEYGVDPGKVETDPKPKDCDFRRSPLGDKGCSYQAVVKASNAAGAVVGGDDAPRYSRSTDGRPIISYDGGKTWDWYWESTVPDKKVASVHIFWLKHVAE